MSDDTPTRLIAIPRRSGGGARPRRPGHGGALRAMEAEGEAHLAALAAAGMETVTSVALAEEDPLDHIPGAVHLPQADATIIAPKPGLSADNVREILGEEYIVMPDVDLTIPATAALGPPIPADQVQAADAVLPDVAGVRAAHENGNRGEGVVVAVFDTGCDADHAEFVGRTIDFGFATLSTVPDIRERRAFDSASHGTHVCGVTAGKNVGVAPGADLIVASVIESERTSTSASRLYTALAWLVDRISRPEYEDKPTIISMSLGFTAGQISEEDFATTMEGIRQTLRQMLIDDDILPVIAIGNEGAGHVRAPGCYPEAVGVGAVDYQHRMWCKSGSGPGPAGLELEVNPDVVGYGVGVVSSTSRDIQGASWYGAMSGTSMATPYVAGVAALLAEQHGVQGEVLRAKLLDSAQALPALDPDQIGRGLACAN